MDRDLRGRGAMMNSDDEIERIGEVFRENGIGLTEVAKWWVYTYPLRFFDDDLIGGITTRMMKILEELEKRKKVADSAQEERA